MVLEDPVRPGYLIVLLALVVVQLSGLFKSDRTVPHLTNPRQIISAIGVEDSPTWSPDGGRLAYASQQSGNWDIWVTLHSVPGVVGIA